MPTTTTNYALYMYNATTDQAETFANFRANIAGTGAATNMQIIDGALDDHDTEIAALQAKKNIIAVDAAFSSGTLYTATVSEITAYADNDVIDLILDTDITGTATLQVNSLLTKSLMKVNAAGTAVNLAATDLEAGRHYLFSFDLSGDKWIWVAANSGDQIGVAGTVGNLLQISSDGAIEDSTKDITDFTENTDTSVSGNAWVLDEDAMGSNSATKVATQQSIKRYVDTLTRSVGLAVTNSDVSVAVADGTVGILIPSEYTGWDIVDVIAGVTTKGVTGTTNVMIRKSRSGADTNVLSTAITIASQWFASDGVINTANDGIITGDVLFVDVDVIHSGTAPLGLYVTIVIQKP